MAQTMAQPEPARIEEIKTVAHKLRASLGVENEEILDMRTALEKLAGGSHRIRVEVVPDSKATSAAWVSSQKLFVKKSVLDSLAHWDQYARYTIAHEIGRLILHYAVRSRGISDRAQKEEREAAIFASEFLMPGHLVPYQTVEDIQKNFRVSRPASLQRFLETKTSDELRLAPAVRASTDIVNELAIQGYSETELSDLVVPKRTLARRRSENELLTVEETDKALRLKRIATLAEQVFGNRIKANRWLRKPKRSLGGETPLAFLASENGARVVEEMLGRIEHGIYA